MTPVSIPVNEQYKDLTPVSTGAAAMQKKEANEWSGRVIVSTRRHDWTNKSRTDNPAYSACRPTI